MSGLSGEPPSCQPFWAYILPPCYGGRTAAQGWNFIPSSVHGGGLGRGFGLRKNLTPSGLAASSPSPCLGEGVVMEWKF